MAPNKTARAEIIILSVFIADGGVGWFYYSIPRRSYCEFRKEVGKGDRRKKARKKGWRAPGLGYRVGVEAPALRCQRVTRQVREIDLAHDAPVTLLVKWPVNVLSHYGKSRAGPA